jgi:tetratricopeptide (TPR) repeat protein
LLLNRFTSHYFDQEDSAVHKNLARVLFAFQALVSIVPACSAQSTILDLPRQSQHAIITQRVGITDITLNYHRPLVNGRKIWGSIVPYGQVWRAGANENTTVQFTDPVTIEGKPLPKGTYGLHMIPAENEWTVIFSKNATSWGSFTYDQKEDALRVTVKPRNAEFHEALAYDFEEVKPDSTVVTLRWEKVAVPFKVSVNTNEIVQASLQNQLRGLAQYTWFGWDDAATYLVDNKLNMEDALKYEELSLQNEERFDNLITKARVLDAMGRKADAAATRDKALAMANAIQLHGYGRQLQTQGQQEQAFTIFQTNIKKNPNHWIIHNEMARIACSKGDYENAAREMKLSAAGAPDQTKPFLDALAKRLEAKEDINK